MTLQDWIDKYNRKCPEPFKRDERYDFFFVPDKGFCEIGQTEHMIQARQMCGDMLFWRDALEKVCKASGLKVIGTYCVRNPLAYIRRAGFSIERREETPEGARYFCIDKRTGQRGQISPAWETPIGTRAYYVTWEVNSDDVSV